MIQCYILNCNALDYVGERRILRMRLSYIMS